MSFASTASLFLNDLHISGFRGINELRIPKLGRVTLLAGSNGVGKTSVLEAVQAYATGGRPSDLSVILSRHEEFIVSRDDDGDKISVPDPTALFFGRQANENSVIKIGPIDCSEEDKLKIVWTIPNKQQKFFGGNGFDGQSRDLSEFVMRISFAGESGVIPLILQLDEKRVRQYSFQRLRNFDVEDENSDFTYWPESVEFHLLGPGLVSNLKLEELWDEIALTDDETKVTNALQLVVDQSIKRVALGGGERGPFGNSRGIIVRLQGQDRPVPLRSLGDGATRLFAVALALTATRDGIIAIDEVENGIHHSLHIDFWRIIFQMAIENSIQILATTHSLDCIRGFAQAASEFKSDEGVLIRLEKSDGKIQAITYPEHELCIAAEQGIEVR